MVKSKVRGFTLIELVVVIVILGILAAFAVPKFMGLESQARIATVNAMEGTLKSSANMAYGVWLASGGSGAGGTVTIEGANYAVAYGYPTATTASIGTLIQDTSGWTLVGANPITFEKVGAPTPATCSVIYTAAASATTTPTYTLNTAGC